ncbi:BglG family transcription antiterminator [Bacillus sp. T33-2]|uniref:BglG family transcription antiterminator n=1 Tax=Bacillus sp. T33-2 TaxID=2054168 RepID=UPI000C778FC3|nr:BglG family transcription antiterminator [Bacillus sp. T33-2]PLR98522.1 PTS sugar transporter [Bacillus sp. T33-2]
MLLLSKRQKDILMYLIKSSEPIPADWIAKELGVSDRTVRDELKQIQQNSSMLGINIESIRGKGYIIKVLHRELFAKATSHFSQENNQLINSFEEQEYRVRYILKRLLLAQDFLKLESLEEETFVSKSTLQTDLKLVRKMIQKYKLNIINRPHYGTKIEGDEYMKRLCLSDSMLNRNRRSMVHMDSDQLLDKELLENIRAILITKANNHNINISDFELENLAVHIAIACKRLQEGFIIEPIHIEFNKEHTFEKIVSAEIIKEVESLTKLSFPKSEIDYIIVHLLGTKLLTNQDSDQFDDVHTIVNRILEKLKTELNWDFSGDKEFIKSITLHLRPAINRLKYGLNIRNPLLSQIKTKYPSAFEGAVIASKSIEEILDKEVGQHEIAYLALHIGVALQRMKEQQKKVKRVLIVCASGVGSASLLYYHLENVFQGEIEIVDTISYYKLIAYNLSDIDFIISTIPIEENLGVPVLVVNTFLEDADIIKIKNKLTSNQNDKQEYLDPSRIFIHKEFENKESTIQFLCNELHKQGLVSKNYAELVLEREKLAATCFGNLVAVPHPIRAETSDTFWTICTLKSPIQWDDDKMVQFVCLLNIEKGSEERLSGMYQQLIKVIENKSVVQKLIKSQSKEEIINIMHGQIGN